MNTMLGKSNALHWMLGLAAFVVIVAGMKAVQSLLVPFLIAASLAIICGPPIQWLQAKRIPTWLAYVIVAVAASLVIMSVVAVAGASINDFVSNIDEFNAQLNDKKKDIIKWFEKRKINISDQISQQSLDPKRVMQFATSILSSVGAVLGDGFLVLLTLIFILLEAAGFPRKLKALHGGATDGLERAHRIRAAVTHYVAIKTWVSLATGVLITVWLLILKVDYALLWGLLAFFFNFVPNIGSVIAALPAVMLAFVDPGPRVALLAALGYGVVNIVVGNVIEPRIMGKGLGLSTLVVFLSLVFWGWVLGPIGMLPSVPLTMVVKIVLEDFEDTRRIAILLGSDVELDKPTKD